MDPHNSAANSARPRAEKAITKLPRWKMVEDEAAEARRKFAADLAAIPTPVGRLAQGKTKRWEFRAIHAAKLPAGPVDLVVVVPSKTRGEWWVIGEAEPGESPRIVAPAPGAMIEGRLVFARPKP